MIPDAQDNPALALPDGGSRLGEFFSHLFDTSGFPARWHCGNWSAELGWLHILSDCAIFVAYATIPAALLIFVMRRRDVPMRLIFWLFIAFILSCGLTHLVDATMFYYPMYRFLGLMKLITALVSLTTVVALVRVLPAALALPALARASVQARAELVTHKEIEKTLLATRQQLEERGSQLTVRDRRFRKAMQAANAGAVCWNMDTGQIEWEIGLGQFLLGTSSSRQEVQSWRQVLTPEAYATLQKATQRAADERTQLVVELPVSLSAAGPGIIRVRAHADTAVPDMPTTMTGIVIVLESGRA